MDRNFILAAGALLWTVAALDLIGHIITGDLMAAAVMVTAGIAGVALVALREWRRRLPERV
jgi:hypothetical protein